MSAKLTHKPTAKMSYSHVSYLSLKYSILNDEEKTQSFMLTLSNKQNHNLNKQGQIPISNSQWKIFLADISCWIHACK